MKEINMTKAISCMPDKFLTSYDGSPDRVLSITC